MTSLNGQRLRAGASGMVATGVDFGAMALLLYVFGMPVALAALAAFIASALGAVTNFLINKFWAFEDPTPITLDQIAAYGVVSIANALIVAALVHGFVHLLHITPLLSKAIAALITFLLWTYPAQAKFVFSARRPAFARVRRN